MSFPYSKYQGTPLWEAVDVSISELVENQDLVVTTAKPYVVGFLCHRLSSAGIAEVRAQPSYPLTIKWPGEAAQQFESEADVARELEWFDSDDPTEPIEVLDSVGRSVSLKVEGLSILLCQLK